MNTFNKIATCMAMTALLGLSGCIVDGGRGRHDEGQRDSRNDSRRSDNDRHNDRDCEGSGHDNADGRHSEKCPNRLWYAF